MMLKEEQKGEYIIIFVLYSFQKVSNRSVMSVEEKRKYHTTFFWEKNKSIILHHVLPNSPENIFLRLLL